MTAKKRKKPTSGDGGSRRKQPASQPPSASFEISAGNAGMERIMRDIGKLLESQNFSSIEEANQFLQALTSSGGIPPSMPSTGLEEAQELIYDAQEESNPRKRIKLARKALSISPDCADAYVLLAEDAASTLQEAKEFYTAGVEAGERALGPEAFKEDAGHFWGLIETRPYMRARQGLAEVCWLLGERQEAIEHYQDMLRLNPNDNQGVRYSLINCLLEVGDDRTAGRLLDQFRGDAMATWQYSGALWAFRRHGARRQANSRLDQALQQNQFVPDYLLGRKRLPRQLPEYIGWGDENEAIEYAASARPIWVKTPGALEWLKERNSP